MKKIIICLLLILFLAGCGRPKCDYNDWVARGNQIESLQSERNSAETKYNQCNDAKNKCFEEKLGLNEDIIDLKAEKAKLMLQILNQNETEDDEDCEERIALYEEELEDCNEDCDECDECDDVNQSCIDDLEECQEILDDIENLLD